MPPDLLGNIVDSSAWMLFCSAPKVIEMVHRTNAPVVPSAPIDDPSAAMRKPGFASATTKPSHQVMALRSCLSSTSAYAIGPSLSNRAVPQSSPRTNWYRTAGDLLPLRSDAVNGRARDSRPAAVDSREPAR